MQCYKTISVECKMQLHVSLLAVYCRIDRYTNALKAAYPCVIAISVTICRRLYKCHFWGLFVALNVKSSKKAITKPMIFFFKIKCF